MLARYQCQLYETPGYASVRLRNQINKYTCITPPQCHYTKIVSYLSLCVRKPIIWVPTRSDTNRTVQSQNSARNLKFRIKEEEGLYYPCRENKGADHLRSNCEADLRLCFRLCRLLVFPCGGLFCF